MLIIRIRGLIKSSFKIKEIPRGSCLDNSGRTHSLRDNFKKFLYRWRNLVLRSYLYRLLRSQNFIIQIWYLLWNEEVKKKFKTDYFFISL